MHSFSRLQYSCSCLKCSSLHSSLSPLLLCPGKWIRIRLNDDELLFSDYLSEFWSPHDFMSIIPDLLDLFYLSYNPLNESLSSEFFLSVQIALPGVLAPPRPEPVYHRRLTQHILRPQLM